MIHVLHVIGYIGCGGDTTVVMDIMNGMDPEKYHFDFVTHEREVLNRELIQELTEKGCKIYILKGDVRKLGPVRYFREVLRLLRTSEIQYDAIHTHTSMQSGVALAAAYFAGVRNRICHSHISAIQRKASFGLKLISIPLFRSLIMLFSTKRIACSKMAGDFLFGTNYELLYNGVDIHKFSAVSEYAIQKKREELGINATDVVIGHVAHFGDNKNQQFDLTLAERLTDRKDLRFILVGSGNNFNDIQKSADQHGGNVLLTGRRSDVHELMYLFDCVILPSLPGEGFPVTLIEAQTAGCPCLISEYVTEEVDIGLNLVKQLPLSKPDLWEAELRLIKHEADFYKRKQYNLMLKEKGFGKEEFLTKWLKVYSD